MAEALLSSLFTVILENLNSRVLEEFGIASGLNTEIETLKSTFTTIHSVLQDAESQQWKSEPVRNWLRKLKGAAYDADNILEGISTEALLRRMDRERGVKHRVSAFFSERNQLLFRVKTGRKVKNIRERLDAIAEERSKFHFKVGVRDVEVGAKSRQTSSLVNKSEVIGRDEEKEMIIEKLVNQLGHQDDDDDIPVYAICGMGGLGKTTLAQLVHNDERVKGHFELQIWVCVSDDFDITRLTRAIIEAIEGSPCNILELDSLQRKLQEKLRGKRFLLVLDDVWNEYRDKWDGLKNALRCGGKGSMVIVTTRLENVALIMATFPVHHMDCLSEEDSWSLFKRRAFGIGGREENPRMERIGKEIVKKCGGLPLAVKALGSLMWLKRSESEWLSLKESEIWDLSGDGSTILPALRLSFDNLPPHSRQCFAYCCIFPKDYRMKREELIELWMANGFLPSRGQVDPYVVGCEIFNDLVWRSFFQDVEKYYYDGETCKMHDLMHDLARNVMGDECLIIEDGKELKIPEGVRHVCLASISSSHMITWTEYMLKVKSLRTIVVSRGALHGGNFSFEDIFSVCISKQKYIRVLHLNDSYISSQERRIPKSIGNLIHLKYLDLSCSSIKSLPESTSCLQNLQMLKLTLCEQLLELPKGMKYMRNLRKLDIRGCNSLIGMPAGMRQLTRLQTLSMFIVGQGRGFRIGELEELKLEGELKIKRVDNIKDSADAKSANLKSKEKLVSLSLCWENQNKGGNKPENAEEVLEGLQPHSNLKELQVYNYQGSRLPSWMFGLVLENLVELSLKDCERCEDVPSLGKLPFLRVLNLVEMGAVKSLSNNFYGDGEISFPALESLNLNDLRSLEEWKTPASAAVRGGESFPCLQYLHISRCPKLTEFPPHLPRLDELCIFYSAMLIGQVMSLSLISSLEIGYMDELVVLPNGLLKNKKVLEHLGLEGLSNLKNLSNELDNLTALKYLSIYSCPSLESLPEEGLENLKSLEALDLQHCKKMESLTEGVRHLTALRQLTIWSCPEMRSLPDGLQNLSTLKHLVIKECPVLERRCKKDTGEDWPKISHIPTILINYDYIQNLCN